jgi:hypothetical protein
MHEKPIKKEDVEETLNIMVARGEVLASCPLCKEYLNYAEYQLCYCSKCKKIDFDKILYFAGCNKENN